MESDEVGEVFLARLEARSLDPATLAVEQGIEAMLAFYVEERCEGCDLANDGDMLLYQWGYEKRRGGFELDLTRQLIAGEGEDEDILQLTMRFHFEADPELIALPPGDEWCATPAQLDEFRAFIEGSAAFRMLRSRPPLFVRIELESV